MLIDLNVKYPLFLSDFYGNVIFAIDLKKTHTQIPNFMEVRPVGAELFHADEQTDRHDEANSCLPFATLRTQIKTNPLMASTERTAVVL